MELDHITLIYRIFWRSKYPTDPNLRTPLSSGFNQIQEHFNRISTIKFVCYIEPKDLQL